MNFAYERLSKDESLKIRQKFIDSFVDVNKEWYIKYIKPLKADDVWQGFGHCHSYLWSCLKDGGDKLVKQSVITEYLSRLGDKELYVMFDVYPKEHILPDGYKNFHPSYTKLFPSDTVLKMSADEFLKVLINDMSSGVYDQFFGEDIYAFDESLEWFAATTHEFFEDEQGVAADRICFAEIGS